MNNLHFKRQKLNIPLQRGQPLSAQRAAEVIQKAFQLTSVGFEWTCLDKPVDGTLLLFHTQPQPNLPSDGYGWMHEEVPQRYTLQNGMEMFVYIKKHGFAEGEGVASMHRHRYRMVQNPEIQLLHYVRAEGIPVNLAAAKEYPRPSKLQPQPQVLKNRGVPVVKVVEEVDEGDDTDRQFGRILALERYKRNHMLMEQILSPFSTQYLQKPAWGTKTKIEDVVNMNRELEAEIQELNQQKSLLVQFREESAQKWKQIQDLKT